MPQVDLKYTTDLEIDAVAVLKTIETTIHGHDSSTGECKGRAYPTAEFNHSNLVVEISMLPKEHRDTAYLEALSAKLETAIKAHVNKPHFFSLVITFLPDAFIVGNFQA